MTFGLGVLRLSSVDFWAMTPRELAEAAGRLGDPPTAISRSALNALIHRFPDQERV